MDNPRPLRIVYVGNFGPDWSTETHVAASLEALGHTVVRAQEASTPCWYADGPPRGRREAIKGWTLDEIRGAANESNLLLWTRTWDESGRGWRMLEGLKVPSVAYHLDLYAGLERARDVEREPWWRCDYVFTADGGSDEFWQRHGINHRWMPPGVYHAECFRGEPDPRFACEVAFVGSYGYHPEWPYRRQLVDFLRSHYGARFRLFGSDGNAVRGRALNNLYASVRVAVGDSLCLGFNHPRYWSDRVHETTGRGGVIVHPLIPGLGDFYTPDEISYYKFGDFAALRDAIDRLLADDAERERQRAAGFERTRRDHTYLQRLEETIRILRAEGAIR